MPRWRQHLDWIDDDSEEGQEKRTGTLDVPPQDYCRDIYVDLQPDSFVQLRKGDDGKWSLATNLEVIKEVKPRQKKQN